MNFFRISRQIPEKSDAFCFFNQICENKSEICRKFWTLWEILRIIHYYSKIFTGVLTLDENTSRRVDLRERRWPVAVEDGASRGPVG